MCANGLVGWRPKDRGGDDKPPVVTGRFRNKKCHGLSDVDDGPAIGALSAGIACPVPYKPQWVAIRSLATLARQTEPINTRLALQGGPTGNDAVAIRITKLSKS
jgi:hypothetical protein